MEITQKELDQKFLELLEWFVEYSNDQIRQEKNRIQKIYDYHSWLIHFKDFLSRLDSEIGKSLLPIIESKQNETQEKLLKLKTGITLNRLEDYLRIWKQNLESFETKRFWSAEDLKNV